MLLSEWGRGVGVHSSPAPGTMAACMFGHWPCSGPLSAEGQGLSPECGCVHVGSRPHGSQGHGPGRVRAWGSPPGLWGLGCKVATQAETETASQEALEQRGHASACC